MLSIFKYLLILDKKTDYVNNILFSLSGQIHVIYFLFIYFLGLEKYRRGEYGVHKELQNKNTINFILMFFNKYKLLYML